MLNKNTTQLSRIFLITFFCITSALLNGCCSTPIIKRASAENKALCSPNGLPNSEEVIGSKCEFPIQMAEVCEYDHEGRLKNYSSKPDGVCLCFGSDF